MWNFLLVIVIAIVIWMLNPLIHFNPKHDAEVQQKTKQQVQEVENQAIQQVNQAREMQKNEMQREE